jgi:lantibiotic modifying enzyme
MSWQPILSGVLRERALTLIDDIAAELSRRFRVASDVVDAEAWSLATGRSGVAVFLAYYAAVRDDAEASDLAAQLVAEALDSATGNAILHQLYSGLAGVGWTLAHLEGSLLDLADGDPNDAIERALLDLIGTGMPLPGGYDLVSGLAGVGIYALERAPRPSSLQLLQAVVERLAKWDVQDSFWWTPHDQLPPRLRSRFPSGACNLGMAHGAAGVIAVLAKAQALGLSSACPMLHGTVDWFLGTRLPADAGSTFASLVAPDVAPRPSPLSWCYGDPGAAVSLFLAARAGASAEWQGAALATAEHAARRTLAGTQSSDLFVCHGASGLAHSFNRLHQMSGSELLRAAALSSLEQVLDSISLHAPSGFLTGLAGIGLVLAAAATPKPPDWDRLMGQ